MEESIASNVARCLDGFRDILEGDNLKKKPLATDAESTRRVEDEQAKFRVWAGSMSAHRKGMSSLDYRLRDASHIRSQVVRLLKDLQGNLKEVTTLCDEAAGPNTANVGKDRAQEGEGDTSGIKSKDPTRRRVPRQNWTTSSSTSPTWSTASFDLA